MDVKHLFKMEVESIMTGKNNFDPALMEVLHEHDVNGAYILEIYTYNGGKPKIRLSGLTSTGKQYPLKNIPVRDAQDIAKGIIEIAEMYNERR